MVGLDSVNLFMNKKKFWTQTEFLGLLFMASKILSSLFAAEVMLGSCG